MKMKFHQYRSIIEVFKSFGILISGQWKYKSFTHDFKVDQLYVKALIFELELRLDIYMNEESFDKYCCPQSIVLALSEYNSLNMEGYPIDIFHGMDNNVKELKSV